VKSHGQFCPVAQAMEVLGERWTLLVVRELLCGSHRFNELARGVPLMSRTMLSQRLKSLEAAGVVERSGKAASPEYHLTRAGQELRPIVEGCGVWASRWLRRDPTTEELDAGLLMWDVRRNIDLDALPDRDVLVQFFFPDARLGRTRFWLHLRRVEIDLCLTHPGFDVDLRVEASVLTMTRIWLGRQNLRQAMRSRELRVSGDRRWIAQLPRWLKLSQFAAVSPPAGRSARSEAAHRAGLTLLQQRKPR
jgi:DNA-binding HxlR family transcriptional regulator